MPTELTMKEGVVRWISDSNKNNSFNLEGDEKTWYSYQKLNEDEGFENYEPIEFVIDHRDTIKFNFEKEGTQNIVKEIIVLKKEEVQKYTGTTKTTTKSFDDGMLNLEKLLDKAHAQGLKSVYTEMDKELTDLKQKTAVFKATVTMSAKPTDAKDRVFTGHGDAMPENMKAPGGKPSFVEPHFLRMAETRAIVRALRWATNQAKAAEEEKGGPEKQ